MTKEPEKPRAMIEPPPPELPAYLRVLSKRYDALVDDVVEVIRRNAAVGRNAMSWAEDAPMVFYEVWMIDELVRVPEFRRFRYVETSAEGRIVIHGVTWDHEQCVMLGNDPNNTCFTDPSCLSLKDLIDVAQDLQAYGVPYDRDDYNWMKGDPTPPR